MSRIGKQPVRLPEGTTFEQVDNVLHIKGKKGELSLEFPVDHVDVKIEDGSLMVTGKQGFLSRKFQGLVRSKLKNMVEGVTEGYKKELVIIGVGYKSQIRGTSLVLSLGFSHPVEIKPIAGISFMINPEDPSAFFVQGIDKVAVGQVSSDIRSLRPPEPYKGKGIRYRNEYVLRKAGKSAGK